MWDSIQLAWRLELGRALLGCIVAAPVLLAYAGLVLYERKRAK